MKRVVGAVLLGIGTVFGLKGETNAHWATPPDLVVSAEVNEDAADSGPDS